VLGHLVFQLRMNATDLLKNLARRSIYVFGPYSHNFVAIRLPLEDLDVDECQILSLVIESESTPLFARQR
jgi:hypothetical protein